jgi:hypothetical protein
MIDINNNNNKKEDIEKESTSQIKENILEKEQAKKDYNERNFNNINNNYKQPEDDPVTLKIKSAISSKDIEKKKPNCIQIDPRISKVKTFNNNKRIDGYGNIIIHGGKQKVSFKNNLTEVVKIENYKEYNKMEEPTNNHGNGCCLLL